jgi:hypothetical protein
MRLFLLLFLFATSTAFSQTQCTGKVIDRTLKTPIKGAIVFLSIEDYAHGVTHQFYTMEMKDSLGIDPELILIDSMVTDSTGRFAFTVQDSNKYSIECILLFDNIHGYWDCKRRLCFDDHSNNEIILTVPEYCEYKQYKNQDSCPVCKLKDKCIPVAYGLPTPDLTHAEDMLDPEKRQTFPGGCLYDERCHARWYCKRCEKLF